MTYTNSQAGILEGKETGSNGSAHRSASIVISNVESGGSCVGKGPAATSDNNHTSSHNCEPSSLDHDHNTP